MKKVHTHIETRDIGDQVICDSCGEEFPPGDPRCGGILFVSNAYCPNCVGRMMDRITAYGEEKYIRVRCPDGMTFHDWVMQLRGGDNTVKIITKELR